MAASKPTIKCKFFIKIISLIKEMDSCPIDNRSSHLLSNYFLI